MLAQTRATLAQMGPFAPEVLEQRWLVFFSWCGRRVGVGGLELVVAGLAVVDVAEEVEVVVEEVCATLARVLRVLIGSTYTVVSR